MVAKSGKTMLTASVASTLAYMTMTGNAEGNGIVEDDEIERRMD